MDGRWAAAKHPARVESAVESAMSSERPAERPALASVEEVREELRRLGYLDSGLDRFVLAGAGGGSALRASSGAALRVGLAGGALFGGGLTLAAAGLDRRLLAAPRDLAVLTLYLALALGVVTA